MSNVRLSRQQRQVLDVLRRGPVTSWDLCFESQVLCYTKRISELRRLGFEIDTSPETISGRRVVTYTLLKEVSNGKADSNEV